jgi:non-ribosomal peptide synthetase component F
MPDRTTSASAARSQTRARAEVEGIFGFFVNMVALRSQPRADLPLGAHIQAMRETVEAAFAHQSAPFERVVEAAGAARRLDHAPLFQTVLVLQNAAGQSLHLPGLDLDPFALPAAPPKFDLTVTAVELADGGLSLNLGYDAGLFRPDTVGRIGRNLVALLGAMATADPATPLGDLSFLGLEEETLLTVTLARGARIAQPADPVARIAALAAAAPQDQAVECGDEGLTRGALDLLSRRFATALRRRGIGPGDLVAIHAEAAPWRVAAMLGVLRCGAAYLPLEPSYPLERLAFMLADARAGTADRRGADPGLRRRYPAPRPGRGRGSAGRSCGAGCGSTRCGGLCDLYLGVHRPAEGRGCAASWLAQPVRLDGGLSGLRRRQSLHRDDALWIRRVGGGNLADPCGRAVCW